MRCSNWLASATRRPRRRQWFLYELFRQSMRHAFISCAPLPVPPQRGGSPFQYKICAHSTRYSCYLFVGCARSGRRIAAMPRHGAGAWHCVALHRPLKKRRQRSLGAVPSQLKRRSFGITPGSTSTYLNHQNEHHRKMRSRKNPERNAKLCLHVPEPPKPKRK